MSGKLLWLDLETDGIDHPRQATVLEIGAVITDYELNKLNEFRAIFPLTRDALFNIITNDTVREMHINSGLLGDCLTLYGRNYNYNEVKNDVVGKFMRFIGPDKIILAGSGVSHFDSRILYEQFPAIWHQLEGFNDYTKPTLDIGCVRRFMEKIVGIEIPKVGNHRALDDCNAFIEQTKAMSNTVKGAYYNGMESA